MKRKIIFGLSALTILTTAIAMNAIPSVAGIFGKGSVVAQNTQKQQKLQLILSAEKQVLSKDIQGKQKVNWQPLQGQVTVQPGDILRYTLTGQNTSNAALNNITLNQPVPKGMTYILKSATAEQGATITYSIDGGRNFVNNPTVQVRLANGKVATQPAPATAYTHIRWKFNTAIAKSAVKGMYQMQVR